MKLKGIEKAVASTSHPCIVTISSFPSPQFSSEKTDFNDRVGGGGEVEKLINTLLPTFPKKSQLETIYSDNKVRS